MLVEARSDKKPCDRCLGYGVFEMNPIKLVSCPKCGSVHAESLGMTYPGPAMKETIGPSKFLYVRKSLTILGLRLYV